MNNFRLITIFLSLSSILSIQGCSVNSINNNDSIENISSQADARKVITKGMTKEQVKAKLGEPIHKMTMNNRTEWIYNQSSRTLAAGSPILRAVTGSHAGKSKNVNVIFNSKGRVIDVGFISQQY